MPRHQFNLWQGVFPAYIGLFSFFELLISKIRNGEMLNGDGLYRIRHMRYKTSEPRTYLAFDQLSAVLGQAIR